MSHHGTSPKKLKQSTLDELFGMKTSGKKSPTTQSKFFLNLEHRFLFFKMIERFNHLYQGSQTFSLWCSGYHCMKWTR